MTIALPFRWSWAWAPFLVIGAAAIANTMMIVTSTRVRPQQVAANAYLDSRSYDASKAARARFIEQGLDLSVTIGSGTATFMLSGPAPGPLTIRAYRPDNAALDASTAWTDPTTPISVRLLPGRWRVDITSAPGPEAIAATHVMAIPEE